MKDEKQVLREAAEYIGEHGWTQNRYVNEKTGAVCAMGAIWCSQGMAPYWNDAHEGIDLPSSSEAWGAFSLLARSLPDDFGSSVPYWNDAPERTAEDVILMMKKVAEQ